MTLITFHPFVRLPRELRDLIWDAAIRPDVPSAHFFTAWDGVSNAHKFPIMVEFSVAGRGVRSTAPCGLAAPRCNSAEPERPSWFDNNPSVYMEDSGLWTACKESREAMIRRFGNHKVAYQKSPEDSEAGVEYLKPPEFNDAPATGTMIQNGKIQYFTVCPSTDLFCLQPFGEHKAVCWKGFEEDVPIFNELGSPKPNIALELNPSWMDDDPNFLKRGRRVPKYYWALGLYYRSEMGCTFYAATDILGRWASKLWFIDYRIRRDPEFASVGDKWRTTFQGRGCKFIEIYDRLDPGWIWGHDRPETSIHGFLERLDEKLEEYSQDTFLSEWITFPPREDAPRIGILACIPDD
ncbi:hypothetical protein K449DRAFT_399138 [Hypoxylon sp. EC38]|nr:hypothetical protein K449DRAFT_399138 [Hypoxylon sp. EC38]